MNLPPLSAIQLAGICREVGAKVRSLVAAHCAGQMNEHALVEALLVLEAGTATPHGLTLTASHTYDDWVVVSLRAPGRADPCAAFEFEPGTGHFRNVGSSRREYLHRVISNASLS